MSVRLTDRQVASLKPKAAPYFTYDDEVAGFAVKVYPSGKRSFTFEAAGIDGKVKRQVVGKFPAWSTGKARDHVKRLRLAVDTGATVLTGRGPKLVDFATSWREVVAATRRPGSVSGYMQALDKYILPAFGQRDPRTIGRTEIEVWHARVATSAPIGCNRALAVLSALMSWLERDGHIVRNPCRGVKRRPETARHVYLDSTEITRTLKLLAAATDRSAALALKIALLTGCRIGEVLAMTSAQVDVKHAVWIKPAATTKQRKNSYIAPLPKAALPLIAEFLTLNRRPPYHACLKLWRATAAALGRPEVRIHDLRHSRASALARNGGSLLQIGKLLGHTSSKTTERYAHLVAHDLRALIEAAS